MNFAERAVIETQAGQSEALALREGSLRERGLWSLTR